MTDFSIYIPHVVQVKIQHIESISEEIKNLTTQQIESFRRILARKNLIDCGVFKEIGPGMDFSPRGITCVNSRQCSFPL